MRVFLDKLKVKVIRRKIKYDDFHLKIVLMEINGIMICILS